MEEKKAMNAQANQRIDTVESTLNKKIEKLQSDIAQKFDNLQYSISKLTNLQQVQEKGKFPSQTQPNLRGVHELSSSSKPPPRIDEVKAVITLKSGKEVKQPVPKPAEEGTEEEEVEPEKIMIKEDAMKKGTPPTFSSSTKRQEEGYKPG